MVKWLVVISYGSLNFFIIFQKECVYIFFILDPL